jgi:hypothetical protein
MLPHEGQVHQEARLLITCHSQRWYSGCELDAEDSQDCPERERVLLDQFLENGMETLLVHA